ncbi:MAG: hypothetical protein KBD00_00045 [Candidatus Peribacteraceae bacterium]|nr:hypothetical protein [Candidatus Peribacteraceae bacterium]
MSILKNPVFAAETDILMKTIPEYIAIGTGCDALDQPTHVVMVLRTADIADIEATISGLQKENTFKYGVILKTVDEVPRALNRLPSSGRERD